MKKEEFSFCFPNLADARILFYDNGRTALTPNNLSPYYVFSMEMAIFCQDEKIKTPCLKTINGFEYTSEKLEPSRMEVILRGFDAWKAVPVNEIDFRGVLNPSVVQKIRYDIEKDMELKEALRQRNTRTYITLNRLLTHVRTQKGQ